MTTSTARPSSPAALLNGLELVGKKISEVKLAVSGAGAAAIACVDLMVSLGVKPRTSSSATPRA
jgi:malic enzyme